MPLMPLPFCLISHTCGISPTHSLPLSVSYKFTIEKWDKWQNSCREIQQWKQTSVVIFEQSEVSVHLLCTECPEILLCMAETENSTGKCFSNLYCIIFVNIIVHHCHLWWFINHKAIKPPNKSYAHPLHITDHFYLLMQELFHMLMKHLWSMYHYTLCLISFSINR